MKGTFSLTLPVVLALALLVSARTWADGAALRAFLDETRTLETAFEQTVVDEKGRHLEASFGRFYLARPDRFRWSYTVPYVQEIVSDGSEVWVYDAELAQVTVRSTREALASAPGLLLSTERPLDGEFTVRDVGREGDLDWVALTPKSSDTPFRQVRVGLRGRELAAMELEDGFGQQTMLRFRGTVRNPKLGPDLFRFEVPPGVDVLRDPGGGVP
jgi:outer membrane lipoprotein carrier protein